PVRGARACLRPATPACAEPGRLRSAGMSEEPHVAPRRGTRRADRPAVDPGTGHAGEEAPVEPRIPRRNGPIPHPKVEPHPPINPEAPHPHRRLSDIITAHLARPGRS